MVKVDKRRISLFKCFIYSCAVWGICCTAIGCRILFSNDTLTLTNVASPDAHREFEERKFSGVFTGAVEYNDTLFDVADTLINGCNILKSAAMGASYIIRNSDYSQILYLFDQYFMHFKTNRTHFEWPTNEMIENELQLLTNVNNQYNWFQSAEYNKTMNDLNIFKYQIVFDRAN